jgi:hypothetical protein
MLYGNFSALLAGTRKHPEQHFERHQTLICMFLSEIVNTAGPFLKVSQTTSRVRKHRLAYFCYTRKKWTRAPTPTPTHTLAPLWDLLSKERGHV